MRQLRLLGPALGLTLLTLGRPLTAQAIRTDAGFAANALVREDDNFTDLVGVGFDMNFFGLAASEVYVNNNGNVTFDAPLSAFTPFPLSGTKRQIIAPFFGDVDTRLPSPGQTRYGQSTIGGRAAFGVNWFDVGYFNHNVGKLNTFQLVLIDRSDVGAGDFDFEFNYGQLQWEVGEEIQSEGPRGNANGLCDVGETGCAPARAGWSNGTAASFELTGSGVAGALIDGGANALVSGSNAGVAGRYVFRVRNGVVQVPPTSTVPEPASIALVATGLTAFGAGARRRRQIALNSSNG